MRLVSRLNSILGPSSSGKQASRRRFLLEVLEERFAPATGVLSGTVYLDSNNSGTFVQGDPGIAGVQITLKGNLGPGPANQVNLTTTTDANGNWSFTNLAAGVYQVSEKQSPGYKDGQAQAGSAGGNATRNSISNIQLADGVQASGYNFGELQGPLPPAPKPPKPGSSVSSLSSTPGITYISGNSSDYPFTSSNPLTSVGFNESDVLAAAAINTNNGAFDVWYTDEHALTLGVSQLTIINANGTSTTTSYPVAALNGTPGYAANPAVGAAQGVDPAGRPLAPSLYLTDITNNPSSRSGDWQYGGAPIAPSAVFGVWKSATETIDYTRGGAVTINEASDPTANGWNLGPGADPPPPGLATQGYTAEIRWNLSDLENAGLLLPGHNYRFYVMVHDGDQNRSGGDVGQASYQLINPTTAIPAPSTPAAAVSGFALDQNGSPVSGATVTLSWTDSTGAVQTLTVTTDSTGAYSFTNLAPGSYTLTQTPPSPYTQYLASVGTVTGNLDGSIDSGGNITNISLNAGDNGVNYDFNDQAMVFA
jgi:hypothetical protein